MFSEQLSSVDDKRPQLDAWLKAAETADAAEGVGAALPIAG
jgi:hypothetical protein